MIIEDLKSRRVAVLGFGQEGQAVTSYLLRHGIKPVLFDKRPLNQFEVSEQALIRENSLETVFGLDYLEQLHDSEIIFRSPGIWRRTPQLLKAEQEGAIITSQVKWFFEHCLVPIIGITGTKGKGTTASLITHILRESGHQVYLTGNVGQVQPLDFLDNLEKTDNVVYELSSFQLQDLIQSPHIAVVLMVTNDHLDVHASVDEYHQAKGAITKYQGSSDFAIINDDVAPSKAIGSLGLGKKLYFSRQHPVSNGVYVEGHDLIVAGDMSAQFDLSILPLRGQHNWDNAAAAILTCLIAGVEAATIEKALPSFKGLPHRLQQLPDQDSIHFYDDSISTVPDTTIAGIRSYTEPLIVLIGGSDKGLDPEPLIQELARAKNIKAVVTLGATGPSLARLLEQKGFTKPILKDFSDLKTVMASIKKIAQPGDVVLLSPGYASFGWFENYKQRGDEFARLAAQWPSL